MHWLLLILIIPYLYILLRIYSSLRKISPCIMVHKAAVRVSVIVACRNEEERLPGLLSGLSLQDYDPDLFEIIIADDHSADKTRDLALGYRGIRNLKVLESIKNGKKAAVRSGVEASTGELIVTTDADCRPGRQWLSSIASAYDGSRPDMIIGPVMLRGPEGFIHRFQELEFLALQGITAGTAFAGEPVMCNGANLAFRKDAYPHDERSLRSEEISGDDMFLLHYIKKKPGSKTEWLESSEALVETETARGWKALITQRSRWISKAGSYNDRNTVILAIVTYITIMLQPVLIIAGIFDTEYLKVLCAAFLLKSVPDFLILHERARTYQRKNLLRWFFPSQILYPWYVMAATSGLRFSNDKWRNR
jgi:cellulose synthase/poly-beta-1,6-N-acetylglucosamine synthase-like glycosyltransferase